MDKTPNETKAQNEIKTPIEIKNFKNNPDIKGYLLETAPFDFNMFLFNTDFDDEKRFHFRKLFSQLQEYNIEKEDFSSSSNYSEFRIKKILYAIKQINHYAYSKPLLEKEIFILLQYAVMLIQVASCEVYVLFKQKYELYQKNKEITEYYDFHLELYEEIFILIDFIQKNRAEIVDHLVNYGQNVIIQKFINPKYKNFEEINGLSEEIKKLENSKSIFSSNFNKYLNLLKELEFCFTLYEDISKNDYLYDFTKKYTRFNKLFNTLLEIYQFDSNLFYNSPTYFRLFFLFLKNDENGDEKLRNVFNSFRFTIHDFFDHLFFGNHETEYVDPLSFKFDYEVEQNQMKRIENEAKIVNSIYSYIKTSYMYSLSPIGLSIKEILEKNDKKQIIQYAFFPIAEMTFHILSNELNSWCIKASESGDNMKSFDYPDVLLRYIRHWTAHEYILYQQSGINVSEATLFALQQNASSPDEKKKEEEEKKAMEMETKKEPKESAGNKTSNKAENQEEGEKKVSKKHQKSSKKGNVSDESAAEASESEKPKTSKKSKKVKKEDEKDDNPNNGGTPEISKTYRVLYHYISFLTSIVQNQITQLEYIKGAHSFFFLEDHEKIHEFLNFKQLYDLAKLLGPEGISFVTKSVMMDLEMRMKDLFDLFILISRISTRKKEKININERDDVFKIKVHQNKVTECFASIGNLVFLRELLKFVLQTYIRNYNPKFYFDMQRVIAKKNAIEYLISSEMNLGLDKDDAKINYPASYEDFEPFIKKFDMEEDCKISEFLYSKYIEQNETDQLVFVAKNCIYLVLLVLDSDYYKSTDKKNEFGKNFQISDLAVARGIDEFFSLLFYFKNAKGNSLDYEKIKKVHEYFIERIYSNEMNEQSKKDMSENDDKLLKIKKFIDVYFRESSFYHQDYFITIGKNSPEPVFNTFKGRKKKRNALKNTFLFETLDWLKVIKDGSYLNQNL